MLKQKLQWNGVSKILVNKHLITFMDLEDALT